MGKAQQGKAQLVAHSVAPVGGERFLQAGQGSGSKRGQHGQSTAGQRAAGQSAAGLARLSRLVGSTS